MPKKTYSKLAVVKQRGLLHFKRSTVLNLVNFSDPLAEPRWRKALPAWGRCQTSVKKGEALQNHGWITIIEDSNLNPLNPALSFAFPALILCCDSTSFAKLNPISYRKNCRCPARVPILTWTRPRERRRCRACSRWAPPRSSQPPPTCTPGKYHRQVASCQHQRSY